MPRPQVRDDAEALRQAREAEDVEAVVLRVNSQEAAPWPAT